MSKPSQLIIADLHIGSQFIECFDVPYHRYIPKSLVVIGSEDINRLLIFRNEVLVVRE